LLVMVVRKKGGKRKPIFTNQPQQPKQVCRPRVGTWMYLRTVRDRRVNGGSFLRQKQYSGAELLLELVVH